MEYKRFVVRLKKTSFSVSATNEDEALDLVCNDIYYNFAHEDFEVVEVEDEWPVTTL